MDPDIISNTLNNHRNGKSSFQIFSTDFLFGGISATLTKICLAPLEHQKMQQFFSSFKQIKSSNLSLMNNFQKELTRSNKGLPPLRFFSPWNFANIIRYTNIMAWNFSIKDYILWKINKANEKYKLPFVNYISGGVAGVLTLAFTYPIDQLNIYRIRQKSTRLTAFKDIVASEGITRLYKGFFLAAFLGVFFYRSFYFGVFDSNRPNIIRESEFKIMKVFLLAWGASFSGFIAATPFENVRKAALLKGASSSDKQIPISLMKTAQYLWKFGGTFMFFKGVRDGITRSISGALVLTVYDSLQDKYFNRQIERNSQF